ncbi:MAG: PepSY domain-containing protein [Sphingomonas sp.]|uniref:PepSY-associated TM helix domain-containing protein n=1 Tax=Sphingomonas sp. TaxID=28214 RepID=UPI002624C34A|nr:PepSY-associated TM helix domain-containing protein [Sphingomonas sp.]MDK2770011.1 PepSY domain-containing protein [Sphingomonas sp.]
MLRTYHRWLAIISGIFMIFIALTGIALQLDLWITGTPPPGAERNDAPPPHRAMPDRAAVARMTDTVFAAMATRTDVSVERIEFNFAAPAPFATVGSANPFGPAIRIDARTGAELPVEKMDTGLHGILQDIHAGYFFGLPGRILSVLLGVGLLVLSFTGLKVYFDLYLRRRKIGKKNPFWR